MSGGFKRGAGGCGGKVEEEYRMGNGGGFEGRG